MNCAACNAPVPEHSRFCPQCGQELTQELTLAAPSSQATPPAHTMTHEQRVRAVTALLAGKHCGACGYERCEDNAEAIVRGISSYDSCVSTNAEARRRIKALLDVTPRAPLRQHIWRWLTSVRLAIWLIVTLALLSIVGTLLPQNAQPATYIERLGPEMYRWIQALQFDRLFQSWYFLALLFALMVNTVCCTIKRSRASVRLLTRPMPDHPIEALQRMDHHVCVPLARPAGALDRIENYLIQRRFRVTKSEGTLKAHKRRLGRLGVDVLHISLVFVLTSAAVGALVSFETFQVAHKGDVFEVPQGGFSVRVDQLWSDSYASSARVKDWYTTLTILDEDQGENHEPLTQTIEVNHPLSYKGVSFYQASFGSDWWEQGHYTVQITRSADGADLGTHPLESKETVFMPEEALSLSYLTFFSDFALDENLQSFNRSGALNNPALFLRLQVGDEPPYDAWAFARNEMRALYQTHMAGDAPYQLNLVGMAAEPYTGIRVSSNAAIPYIYAGFGLMALGLALNFYWPPRWLWITIEGQWLHLGATARLPDEVEADLQALADGGSPAWNREVSHAV